MENTNYNAKCVKCGYIFEADESADKTVCPLCSQEMETVKAMEGFTENFKDYKPKKRTTLRMIIDLAVFGLSLCALIIVLYFLISYIVALAG